MAGKDEVIERLENCRQLDFYMAEPTKDAIDFALGFLKGWDAVEPYQHDEVWLCGNCEREVVGWDDDIDGKEYRYPFCRQCGRSVKWEMKEYIIKVDEDKKDIMGNMPLTEKPKELVRCKNCVRRGNPRECIVAKYAEQTGTPYFVIDNRGEWYCADGKWE